MSIDYLFGEFRTQFVHRPMGPLTKRQKERLEMEIGHEICPRLEFMRFYKPAGTGLWQIKTEDILRFQCSAQSGKTQNECGEYKTFCAFLLENNKILLGFDSVY